jgi:orotidine-5'-phosphate decarboxylase
MSFQNKLKLCWKNTQGYLCVGLDPDLKKIPSHFHKEKNPIFAFNKSIIDATADLVCAYKPQIAYYSGQAAEPDLLLTCEYLRKNYETIPIVLDAKRGDIGSTAEMYAKEAFEVYGADAVTVNPYMGMETIEPFREYKEKGIFVLCKTSNPGSSQLQSLMTPSGKKVFEVVAEEVEKSNEDHGGMGLVAGATHIEDMKAIRKHAPEVALLVPGVGAQGGNLEDVLRFGQARSGQGLLINVSRAVIYVGGDATTFPKNVRAAALALLEQMKELGQQ